MGRALFIVEGKSVYERQTVSSCVCVCVRWFQSLSGFCLGCPSSAARQMQYVLGQPGAQGSTGAEQGGSRSLTPG